MLFAISTTAWWIALGAFLTAIYAARKAYDAGAVKKGFTALASKFSKQ